MSARVDFPIPDSARTGMGADGTPIWNAKRCGCGAAMVWIETDGGRRMPLSLATARCVDGVWKAESHFADCPDAKKHRKK